MGRLNSFFNRNGLLRNIGILAGGTALAQLITFAATIYLTRVYLPEDFGILSLLTSSVSLLAPLTSLRYNKAISMAEDEKELKSLLYLSFIINIAFAILLFIIVGEISVLKDYFDLGSYKAIYWIIPVAVLLFGFTNIFQSYYEKCSKFKLTSSVALTEAASKSFLQYIMHTVLPRTGLIMGYLGALVINFFIYSYKYLTGRLGEGIRIERRDLKKVANKYNKFPKYLTWSNMIDSAAQNICAFTFPFLFTLEALGNFSIAFKVIRLPAMLIGMATRRVYYPKAAHLFLQDKKAFFQLYKKSTITLLMLAILPAILLELFIPYIFEFFFDSNWANSIPYAQWIILYVFFNFINSLAHENMLIFGLQRAFLMAEIFWVILSLTLIYVAFRYESPLLAVALYVVSGVIMELMVFIIQYRKWLRYN